MEWGGKVQENLFCNEEVSILPYVDLIFCILYGSAENLSMELLDCRDTSTVNASFTGSKSSLL